MSRFVRPERTTLHISDGDTLIVKSRLTAGEQREAYARLYIVDRDGRPRLNHLQSGLAMITAYLIDWSLTDDDGAPVPIRGLPVQELEQVVNSLDPVSFAEIKQAIEGHEERIASARAEEKKLRDGINGAEVISSSPSAAAGGSSGYVS